MPKIIHRVASVMAPLCIVLFWTSTVLAELFGSHATVAHVKSCIVAPGLWILIPSLAAAGTSGRFMARSRRGSLVRSKQRRMRFIAINGLLVLVPCALILHRMAAAGCFWGLFYVVQSIELIAGPINLVLLALNARDGLRMTGRLRASPKETEHS